MNKGISAVVSTVLLIALATIVTLGLFYWASSWTPGPEPSKPATITIKTISPEDGRFLVTNTGLQSITLSELNTTEPGVTCDFNGTVTITAGNSKPCYMAPIAGKTVTVFGNDDTGEGIIPYSLTLGFDNTPPISFFTLTFGESDSWTTETIDNTTSDIGEYTSIAVDSNGNPHISYFDDTNNYLRHAEYDGSWNLETIDSDNVGQYTSIAIDDNDYIHISYRDLGNDDLKYAKYNGSWHTETVDTVGIYTTSIDIDSNGYPHISYRDTDNGQLKHAWHNGTAWTKEVVDAGTGNTGSHNSIEIDDNDYIHISYRDNLGQALRHAEYNGTAWNLETVDIISNPGSYSSLALDNDGYPHISHQRNSGYILTHSWHNGTGWTNEVVENPVGFNLTTHSSITADNNNYLHIAFYTTEGGGNLKHAEYNGTAWNKEIADDSAGSSGEFNSIVFHDGYLHVSYFDDTNEELDYARYYLGGTTLTYAANDPDGLEWVALIEDSSTVANNSVSNCETFHSSSYSSYNASSTYNVTYKDCQGNTASKVYS